MIDGYGSGMTEQILGVLAVWGAWMLAEQFLEAPRWMWYALAFIAGIGWQLALDASDWWMGVGIGGAAIFVGLVADCLLLVGDAAKVHVLRNTRGSDPRRTG